MSRKWTVKLNKSLFIFHHSSSYLNWKILMHDEYMNNIKKAVSRNISNMTDYKTYKKRLEKTLSLKKYKEPLLCKYY